MNYKGFDKDLKCLSFQYEIGKEYEQENAKACTTGFHACEDPLDVFGYYPPANSRYCEVEQSGKIDKDGDDSKVASSKIKILGEIGLKGILEAGIKLRIERCTYNGESVTTGYRAGAQATGDRAGAQATGDQAGAQATGINAVATAVGWQATAFADGKHAVASALGYQCKAKGTMGAALVLAERGGWDGESYPLLDIQVARVDGETVKENVWYMLIDGKVTEA